MKDFLYRNFIKLQRLQGTFLSPYKMSAGSYNLIRTKNSSEISSKKHLCKNFPEWRNPEDYANTKIMANDCS